MELIKIFDTTLRDGEQSPGCSMHLDEKITLALQLERLGVDVIEAGFAVSSPGDFESVAAIASAVKGCAVASLARAVKGDIDAAYNAVKPSSQPVVHIFLATSPIHLQHKLRMSEEQVIERIGEAVRYAKTLLNDIEFSAEDASRTPLEFLLKAYQTAVDAGATVINVPDTVGYCTPQEMYDKVKFLRQNLLRADKVILSAHNHNDLGMATANSLSMIQAGAGQVECTLRGIGERAGNTALEEVVMALKVRSALFGKDTRIVTKELYKSCQLLSSIIGSRIPATKPIVGANAYAHESGIHQHGVINNPETYEIINPADVGIPENKIVLGKHSGRHAFKEHCKTLGYEPTDEALNILFDKFKSLCDKKKYISSRDLEALILGAGKPKARYKLISFTASASPLNTHAEVLLEKEGTKLEGRGEGNGTVDSAFKAVNNALGLDIMLADFSITAVTEMQDAQAQCSLKIVLDGNVSGGHGVSTDVLESSLMAYLDALNKTEI